MGIRVRDRIRDFMRLRKQSDTVKIVCLLVLVGVAFLTSTLYHVWGIYQFVNTSAEYILTGEGAVSNQRINELGQNKDISGITRQMELSVLVQYGGAETSLDCTVLSADYMAGLFGTEIPKGASRIYMNETAFSEFQEALSDNNEGVVYEEEGGSGEGRREFDVRYSMEEEAVAVSGDGDDGTGMGTVARKDRSAKLIVLKMGGEEAESFIYTSETETRLFREAAGIRVRFEKHDLDGLHVGNLRKLGYEIENEEMILEEEYELQMKLLHIRYGLVICGICIVGAVMLWRRQIMP